MKCEVYLGPNLRERLLLSPIRVLMRVYGARIQRKALCMKSGDKFVRDRHAEYVATLARATEMITNFSACKDSRKSTKACAKGSDALQLNILHVGEDAYIDAVKREARMGLGF